MYGFSFQFSEASENANQCGPLKRGEFQMKIRQGFHSHLGYMSLEKDITTNLEILNNL